MRTILTTAQWIGWLWLILSFGSVSAQTPFQRVQDHLIREAPSAGFTASDFAALEITDQYISSHTGVTHLYMRQRHVGIRVEGSHLSAHLSADGDLIRVHNQLFPKLASRVNTLTPILSAEDALRTAADLVSLPSKEPPALISRADDDLEQLHIFRASSLSTEDIPVHLAFASNASGDLRLTWYVRLYLPGHDHWWNLWIDAADGQLIRQQDWVHTCFGEEHSEEQPLAHSNTTHHVCSQTAFHHHHDHHHSTASASPLDGSSYLVYAYPVESPIHGSQSVVVQPADSLASPFGWHDLDGRVGPEFTYTRGNNVWARSDRTGNNNPNGYSPDGGLDLSFTVPYDTSTALNTPSNEDAAITNLFYWNNLMHDVWYHKGFDEVAGNFQANNYGRGGVGGDFVIAEAQDGRSINNANFATPPDGFNGRMQMYFWNTRTVGGLQVDTPATVAGGYDIGLSLFGPPLTETPIVAPLALIQDSSGTHEGCSLPLNAADLAGKIVLIDRGTCNFDTKVRTAQNAGAVAVIIINTSPSLFTLNAGGEGVTIPSAMINSEDGALLKAAIQEELMATLSNPGLLGGFDSDVDNGVIVHEYAHGISIRLTGGPTTSCLSGEEQAGEGWSDWFALVMTHRPGDTGVDPRGIGTYVRGQAVGDRGIRRFPYSTDMSVNPTTYASVQESQFSVPHGVGSIMCAMLWDLYWALVERYGYDPDLINGEGGNHVAMQLVIDGLKLQPCSPGFVDVRDAILLADELAYGGANRCLIWETFARRGLGFSADQGSSASRSDGSEAFDLPPLCQDILYLSKTTEQTVATPGDTIAYEFVISNRVGQTLTSVTIVDSLPDVLSYVPGSSECGVSNDAGTLQFDLGQLPDLSLDTCRFQALVNTDVQVSTILSEDSLEDGVDEYMLTSQVGGDAWRLRDGGARSGRKVFFVPNVGAENDQLLEIPSFVPDSNTLFTFWHRYETENGWDGGLIEYRVDTNEWQDLGPYFVRNGYNSGVGSNNPAGARRAFGGNSEGYLHSWVDIGFLAGEEVNLRFRFVSDNNTFDNGWYVDDIGLMRGVSFENAACITAAQGNTYCNVQPHRTYLVSQALRSGVPAFEQGTVRVFPNPAQDEVRISLENWVPGTVSVQLLNLLGQPVRRGTYAVGRWAKLDIALTGLSAGVYVLRIKQDGQQYVERLQVR